VAIGYKTGMSFRRRSGRHCLRGLRRWSRRRHRRWEVGVWIVQLQMRRHLLLAESARTRLSADEYIFTAAVRRRRQRVWWRQTLFPYIGISAPTVAHVIRSRDYSSAPPRDVTSLARSCTLEVRHSFGCETFSRKLIKKDVSKSRAVLRFTTALRQTSSHREVCLFRPPSSFHRYRIMQLANTVARLWTTCPKSVPWAQIERAIYWQ